MKPVPLQTLDIESTVKEIGDTFKQTEAGTAAQPQAERQPVKPAIYCPFKMAGVVANGFQDTGLISCDCEEERCGAWVVEFQLCSMRATAVKLHGLRLSLAEINDTLHDVVDVLKQRAKH